ncbi:hypothetical protein [Marinobacter sp.]|uniref:hypothetical protein n=1 Tax=Marinobacter sp. TaxID=50741 RepID=UPI003A93BA39
MWIIDRSGRQVRSFNETEVDLLERFANDELVGKSVELANAILRRVRQDNQWLRCACTKPNPVMHIALLESGRFVLRNNPGGDDHVSHCPFGKSISRSAGPGDTRAKITRFNMGSVIAPHGEFHADNKGEGDGDTMAPAQRSGVRYPTLSLLLTLLDDAQLNTYNPAVKVSLSEQFQRLRDAASRYALANGSSLAGALDTMMSTGRMIALGKRVVDTVPKGKRAVGFLLDRIEGTEARSVRLLKGGKMDLQGHVERFASNDGPLLALATITPQKPFSKFFVVGHVATAAIASPNLLFPVTGQAERTVVLELIKLVHWLEAKGEVVQLQKPLFDGDNSPDLILRSRTKVLQLILSRVGDNTSEAPANTVVVPLGDDIQPAKKKIIATFLRSS